MSELTPRLLLTETVWNQLDSGMQNYLAEWHTEVVPLLEQCCALYEAELSADQIQSIFQNAEQYAVDSKQYMTRLGKVGAGAKLSADAIKKLNAKVNQLAQRAQQTGPIQGLDRSFEQAKKKLADSLGGDSSKVVAVVDKMAALTKDNPGKSAFLVGLVTVAAVVAAGPLGGAGVGFLMKAGRDVLAGEKLSTAVGKGLRLAAISWLAGFTMEKVGGLISNVYQNMNPVPISGSATYQVANVGNGLPGTFQDASIYGTSQQLGEFRQLWRGAIESWRAGDFGAAEQAFEQAKSFAQQVSQETLNRIAVEGDPVEKIRKMNLALDGLAAAAQGAAAGVSAYDKQGKPVVAQKVSDSVNYELMLLKRNSGIPLTESEQQALDEFGWQDIKKAASGAATKTAQKAKQVAKSAGRQLGQKITARKLQKLWKKAGSPTDSTQIAQVLASAGLDSQGIEAVSKGAGVELPAISSAARNQISGQGSGAGAGALGGSDDVERIMRARKAAGFDDPPEAQPAPQKKTRVTFPGTDLDFNAGWVSADDLSVAHPKVSTVLDKLASGADAKDLSTQEILAARQNLNIKKPETSNESLREMLNRKLGL